MNQKTKDNLKLTGVSVLLVTMFVGGVWTGMQYKYKETHFLEVDKYEAERVIAALEKHGVALVASAVVNARLQTLNAMMKRGNLEVMGMLWTFLENDPMPPEKELDKIHEMLVETLDVLHMYKKTLEERIDEAGKADTDRLQEP